MELDKLKRSLLVRVEERLRELLPDAEVKARADRLAIRLRGLSGEISVDALATVCHGEDRAVWGVIAGNFCNLVVSRVQAHFRSSLSDPAILDEVFPLLLPESQMEDRLVREATPLSDLNVACEEWLPGIRVEFGYADPNTGEGRRVFERDLARLGTHGSVMLERAAKNLKGILPLLPIEPVTSEERHTWVMSVRREGVGPSVLLSSAGHQSMMQALQQAGLKEPGKLVACAPRSNLLLFTSVKDRAAASRMVAHAWAEYDADAPDSVPLSPRLFVISEPGSVRFLDVGLDASRLSDWPEHDLGHATVRAPSIWQCERQGGGLWQLTAGPGQPLARIRFVETANRSPAAASLLAERVRAKHRSTTEVGYGFFNGIAWAWVDTGVHEQASTASMFLALPSCICVLQTEVPEGAEASHSLVLQKVVASIYPH